MRWALLLALPLILVGLGASQLLDADFVVTRARARDEAAEKADRLGAAMSIAVTGLTQALRERLAAIASADEAASKARGFLYTNEASAVVVWQDGHRLFPPEEGGWDLTAGMATNVKALEAAANLQMGAEAAAGWYAGALGPVFFQCGPSGALRQICVALDWPHLEAAVRDALDTAAAPLVGWTFRVRDPFDRFVWARGGVQLASGDVFDLAGSMRGWRISAMGPVLGGRSLGARLAVALPIAVAWLVLVWSKVRRHRDRIAENAARADLVAKLSHDLRTPLANLKLYSELIARQATAGASNRFRSNEDQSSSDPSSQDKIVGYCRVLGEEIDRLDMLAGNTIAFGMTTRQIPREAAAPDDVVHAIVARLGSLLEAAGCRCEVIGGATTICRLDRMGFERILINLLDNARKYAPGTIRVTTALEAGKLQLSVRDWGARFSIRTSGESFGLGLAVVSDLAKANGGGIQVVRCTPGTRVDVTMMVEPQINGGNT